MKENKSIKKSVLARVNMNFPTDLLEKINIKSKEMGISRTSFVIVCVNEYLKQQETISRLPSILHEIKKLQNAETKKKTK